MCLVKITEMKTQLCFRRKRGRQTMKKILQTISGGLRSAFARSYGTDSFSRFLFGAALAAFLLSMISGGRIFYWCGFALMIYGYFRIVSGNYAKRAAENQKYLRIKANAARFFRIKRKQFDDRKEFRYFKCPSCGQEVRVPRGKGRIRISCPKCRTQFEKSV